MYRDFNIDFDFGREQLTTGFCGGTFEQNVAAEANRQTRTRRQRVVEGCDEALLIDAFVVEE
jgi:hypothetical protein